MRRVKEWQNTVILRVLRNEKYCGDLIQKKTFTPDYLTHEKKYNRGEEDFIILRDHHEAIISRDIFERTRQELARRSPTPEQRAKHSNRYALSGKITCGCCGSRFVARSKTRKDGTKYRAWKCYEAVTHGMPRKDSAGNMIGCALHSQINDQDFMLIIQKVIRHLNMDKEYIISELTSIIQSVLETGKEKEPDQEVIERKLKVLADKKERLMDIYLGEEITKDEYRHMAEKYDAERAYLIKKKELIGQKEAKENTCQQMLEEIAVTIRDLALGNKQNDTFYRNLVEKIVVQDRQHIDVFLNFVPYRWHHINSSVPISVKIAATSL